MRTVRMVFHQAPRFYLFILWSIASNQKLRYDSHATFLFLLYPLNLHGAFVQDRKVINHYSYFWGNGIGIVIPRSSGILEWITYRNMGRNEVTVELPPNWYKNDDLWGFALCCVYVAPAYESQYELGHISKDDAELEDEGPGFCCDLSIEGNYQSGDVGFFLLYSCCVKYDVSDMQWVICYPKLAIEESYHTNQWTHFKASFGGAQVEECGIRLVYTEDYEQKHPAMAQGSTSHGNFGEHGSVREDTDSKLTIKGIPQKRAQERSHTIKDSEKPKTDPKY